MTPLPAVLALGNSRIHACASNSHDIVTYIEASIYEHFSVFTTLDIPYVDPDYGHVQFGRDFDNSQFGRKRNIVEDVILFENGFHIRRRELVSRILMREERNSDDFQVGFRHQESRILHLQCVYVVRILDVVIDDCEVRLSFHLVSDDNESVRVSSDIVDYDIHPCIVEFPINVSDI